MFTACIKKPKIFNISTRYFTGLQPPFNLTVKENVSLWTKFRTITAYLMCEYVNRSCNGKQKAFHVLSSGHLQLSRVLKWNLGLVVLPSQSLTVLITLQNTFWESCSLHLPSVGCTLHYSKQQGDIMYPYRDTATHHPPPHTLPHRTYRQAQKELHATLLDILWIILSVAQYNK